MAQGTQNSRRLWLMRLGAVCFGFVLLLCVEGLLRLTGIGEPKDSGDPFVGFSSVVPLFQLNESQTRYEIASSKQVFFRPDSFRAEKAANEFRIFCFGGSTVQGRPYAIETSFTTWLELTLKAADPSVDWEVVNCGGISYASYRLIPILQESLAYEPDLFIIYSGHNEFLEDRTYDDIKRRPPWLKGAQEFALRFHLFGLARQLAKAEQGRGEKPNLPQEVDALLDHEGGLAKYHRDDDWHQGVTEHYEYNLRRMIRLARRSNVPLILANPTSNLRDTPPFKAEPNDSLAPSKLQRFETAWNTAKAMPWDDLEMKLKTTQAVLELDPRHCEAWFLHAKVLEAIGRTVEAKAAYLRAKDEDICPLRMTEAMHNAVLRVAKQTNTPLVDVRAMFDQRATHGIPGDDELVDHVHPRIDGHQWIAKLLYEELRAQGWVKQKSGFEQRRDELFKDNFGLLPENYFPEALSRLEGLNRWARGRMGEIDPDAPPSATLD